jgi:hypothetical protein
MFVLYGFAYKAENPEAVFLGICDPSMNEL